MSPLLSRKKFHWLTYIFMAKNYNSKLQPKLGVLLHKVLGCFTVAQLWPNLAINFGPNFDQVGKCKLLRFAKLGCKSDSGVRFASQLWSQLCPSTSSLRPPTSSPVPFPAIIPYNRVNKMPKAKKALTTTTCYDTLFTFTFTLNTWTLLDLIL